MTYLYGKQGFADANMDAFGRLRISEAIAQFEGKSTYGNEERQFNTTTATGGTATFLSNEAAWNLTTTTSSGSRVVRQSFKYMQYHPGKSQLILLTGVFGTPVANCVKRIGYYDDNDGLYFVQDGTTGFGLGIRTSTSGSPVDTIIYQSSWNIDKMDGTGPSGITLDVTKTNIYSISFQWLGVGIVRYGLSIDGQLYFIHRQNHANASHTQVYIKSAWLPVRYEIVNVGTTATTGSLKQICCSVSSEGGMEEAGIMYSALQPTPTTVGTGGWTPLLSIRIENTLNGVPFRGQIHLNSMETLVTSNNSCVFALIENTTLTAPSWVSVATPSAISYDVSATANSGGIIRYTGFNGKTSNSQIIPSDQMELFAGNSFTLVARGVGGNATVAASLNWREIT